MKQPGSLVLKFLVLAALMAPVGLCAQAAPTASSPAPAAIKHQPVTVRNHPGQQPGAVPSNAAKQAGGDDDDVRNISTWLDGLSRKTGIPKNTLWTGVVVINLLILLWILYTVLFRGKAWSLPQHLRARSGEIRDSLRQAAQARKDSEQRLLDVEDRLARLGQEIESMRTQAAAEAEAEFRELLEQAAKEAGNIARRNALEIEAATKAARQQLREYTADLAVQLAEEHLRHALTPEKDRAVVQQSAQALGKGRA